MNRREMLARTSVATASATVAPLKMDVTSFGAAGDGVTDDATAIQAALDYVGKHGGGVVHLVQPEVNYRIGRGLKLPSNVTLEGPAHVQYPFNAGNKGVCALVADFPDFGEWVIEPMTRVKGQPVAFNQLVAETLPDGVTYNCGVRNILVTSKGTIPYGGIRMHGCPGSIVEGVSIDRVGCGLLVNYCFGGYYKLHVHSLYYGVAAWDDANANTFEIYCTRSVSLPEIVPAPYQLAFMKQMNGHFADTLKLSTDDHATRPYGLLGGSIQSSSVGNRIDVVIERFPGGVFLFNAYATDFGRCYLEADSGIMACGIAATRSRFAIQALHAYQSGTGAVFDFGINVLAKIFGSGILHAASFGKPPVDDGASLLLLEGFDPDMQDAPLQRGIRYLGRDAAWVPLKLEAGWRAVKGYEVPAFRFDPYSHRVEVHGTITGGKSGVGFTLPPHCRPEVRQRYRVAGGMIELVPDGAVELLREDALLSLDGVSFARW